MKHCVCGLLLFGLGLVIGTSGSDDSLLKKSLKRESTAYSRGYAEALSKFRAVAVQAGFARWETDPHTGRRDHFIWLLPDGQERETLTGLTGVTRDAPD